MTARPVVAFAVVGLVLVAGCSAISFGGDGAEPTPTLTPVPLTASETATPTPAADPPPGVSMDGDVSVEALVAAHEAYLADRSYRWTLAYDVTNEWVRPFDGDFTRRAVVGSDAFFVEQEGRGQSVNQSIYVTGGVGYLRTTAGDEPSFDRIESPESHLRYAFAGPALRRFLSGLRFDVAVVERRGETYYRLFAAGDRAPRALGDRTSAVANYTATAYVTSEGFVRTLVVEYDRLHRSGTQRVTVRFDYEDVGSTTVTPPSWVSNVTATPADADGAPPATDTPGPREEPVAGPPTATTDPGSNRTDAPADATTDPATATPT